MRLRGAVILYQQFTNPTAIREKVTAKLKAFFPGAVVTIDSARLRILGGISVNELRVARKDDPEKMNSCMSPAPSSITIRKKFSMGNGFCAASSYFGPTCGPPQQRRHLEPARNHRRRRDMPPSHADVHNGTLISGRFLRHRQHRRADRRQSPSH